MAEEGAKEEQQSQTASASDEAKADPEYEQFLQWKKEKAEREAAKSRSPPKKQKTEEDAIDPAYLQQLKDAGIEYHDLDPQLRDKLRESAQARQDFLTIHQRSELTKYDPDTGSFNLELVSRKRDFAASSSGEPEIRQDLEPRVKQAMLSYHETAVLPSLNKLFQQCELFYNQVSTETGYQQFYNERTSAQVQSLEQSRANRTVLLFDLPPFTNRSALESNIKHYLYAVDIDFNQVAALHNHLLTSASAVVRVEFLTEQQAKTFHVHMRSSKKYWRVPGQPDTKVRSELDQPTDDRIAMQPYYALLDVLAQVTGQPDLQTWKQTLQIWSGRDAATPKLLAQVAYVLDGRYARRYCCLLMIDDEYYDQVLAKWHEAFSDRMRRTMMLVQALRRAVVDKTTTSRSSFDKAFDVSNNSAHLANFPYPMFPMKISTELGRLLESHPMLPFQGAGGLLALTQQAFEDYGVHPEEFGKGSPQKPQSNKGKGKGSIKGKNKPQKGKGKKGPPKDRDHDSRTVWKKWDDDDNDSWGQGWPSHKSWYSKNQQGYSTQTKGQNTKTSGKAKTQGKQGGKKSIVHQVQICLACTCALGYNLDCQECYNSPLPPGFYSKASAPVKSLVCPASVQDGSICGSPLGINHKCDLCKEHRKYWSSQQVQSNWSSIPTARKCELLQLDRILYDMDVLDPASQCMDAFLHNIFEILGDTKIEDYTPEQWAAYWMKKVIEPETANLLPIPKTTKIPWVNPDWDLTTEDIVINYGPLDDQILQATFYTASWFKQLLDHIWKKGGEFLAKRFDLGNWASRFDIAHSPLIPWDHLIASSFRIAYDHARSETYDQPPELEWSVEIFPFIMQAAFDRVSTDLFQTLAEDLATLLDQDDTLLKLITAEAPYNNKGAATAGGYGSLFFDALYWQLAATHGVLRDKKVSQLQAPNNELVLLFEYVLPLLSLTPDQVRAVRSRAHVNKGNIMEGITLALAESGEHWLIWQCAYAIFQQQHKDSAYPWVRQVAVF